MMAHYVEMNIIEVHEYNVMPVYQIGGPPSPAGPMHQMLTSAPDERQGQLICIHMQKADKSPVEPDMPVEGRMMLKTLQQAGVPVPSKLLHIIASANIVVTPEEYDRMGRPRVHEHIKVSFEYERT